MRGSSSVRRSVPPSRSTCGSWARSPAARQRRRDGSRRSKWAERPRAGSDAAVGDRARQVRSTRDSEPAGPFGLLRLRANTRQAAAPRPRITASPPEPQGRPRSARGEALRFCKDGLERLQVGLCLATVAAAGDYTKPGNRHCVSDGSRASRRALSLPPRSRILDSERLEHLGLAGSSSARERPRTFVSALQNIAAAGESKNQHLRDF